jgi:8-oxo-dGDP phosphatase
MRVREDVVQRPSGNSGIYGIVEKRGFVTVIPFDGRRVFLVNQYRHAVGRRLWELPQGIGHGDDPVAMARQELGEETGLRAGNLISLGRIFVAPGLLTQIGHVFLAEDLTQEEQQLEDTEEDLVVRAFETVEVEAMVRRGEISDSVSLAALTLWRLAALP